jgi:DNA-directed RNA polymerase specialized sigma subunit
VAIETIIDRYRQEIYRIGWKIQYKAKVTSRREVPIISDSFYDNRTAAESESRFLTGEWIDSLPTDIEKTIIRQIYILDKTESQVALQLNMSQQAVNKWKRKALRFLSQKANL